MPRFIPFPVTMALTGLLLLLGRASPALAQTNITITHPEAEAVLLNNYDPADYTPSEVRDHPHEVVCAVNRDVSPDSLKSYLFRLVSFENRNTGSDTVSATFGMGASRRWVHDKFEQFSANHENRLIPAYVAFDASICDMDRHRNVIGVLPGTDTAAEGIIIIEGHMDSRCEDNCDVTCQAHGAEDNGSGTVLVMELARVMSQFALPYTLVFMATTGEEQGLWGAAALSNWCQNNNVPVRGVLNNDIVGGILCGQTASPPGCPGADLIDSTSVRIYSDGNVNSPHKCFARWIKLQYEEMLLPIADVPMTISIQEQEDRTGRGGDHIPFRQNGFTALRFTSTHEHGHGNPADSGYQDRQHTVNDIIGVDTDGDSEIDSFFVDFNYLSRNTAINGVAAGLLALTPDPPEFTVSNTPGGPQVEILSSSHMRYRVGVRVGDEAHDFDYVYHFQDSLHFTIPDMTTDGETRYVSVATVDPKGVASLFIKEAAITPNVSTPPGPGPPAPLILDCDEVLSVYDLHPAGSYNAPAIRMTCSPNPVAQQTRITVIAREQAPTGKAYIRMLDMSGRQVDELEVPIITGVNTIDYAPEGLETGIYTYSLVMDGHVLQTRKMVVR